jgi:hypothetical protein
MGRFDWGDAIGELHSEVLVNDILILGNSIICFKLAKMGTQASTIHQETQLEDSHQTLGFNPGTFPPYQSSTISSNVPLVVHSITETDGLQNGSVPHADGYKVCIRIFQV